jgi:LmbE family N-acetylglucosaminyl deacetylase
MEMSVLVISVHLDDETLGCGGTLLKHLSDGDSVHWLNISDATINHPYNFNSNFLEERKQLFDIVNEAYKFTSAKNLLFPAQLLDEVPMREIVMAIVNEINLVRPDIIYLQNRADVHSDHRVAFQAIYASTKNFRHNYIKRILMYETLSETEFAPALPENAFTPNVFIDVSEFMEKKLKIMSLYSSEIMPDNMPRSLQTIRALGGYRGSRIGVKYAEAFVLLFEKK